MKNLFDIGGKTALVTGGSRGIGEMIAAGYVANGVKTYIASRNAEACRATAERLSAEYGRQAGACIAIAADLSGMAGVRSLAAELAEREERLDVLVNNAGAAWGSDIEDFPESGWDKVMNINVKGVFFLTQALLPLLQKGASADDPARIINIGSIDGLCTSRLPTFSYGPSKAAVHHLTRALALHLAKHSVTVNAVAPGPFPSAMTADLLDQHSEKVKRAVPLGRLGEAEDMAGIALFLASRAASYISGSVIPVDGGLTGCAQAL